MEINLHHITSFMGGDEGGGVEINLHHITSFIGGGGRERDLMTGGILVS